MGTTIRIAALLLMMTGCIAAEGHGGDNPDQMPDPSPSASLAADLVGRWVATSSPEILDLRADMTMDYTTNLAHHYTVPTTWWVEEYAGDQYLVWFYGATEARRIISVVGDEAEFAPGGIYDRRVP